LRDRRATRRFMGLLGFDREKRVNRQGIHAVRWRQSTASFGVQTTGLFSLKLVFRITGIPVFRWKAPEKADSSTPACCGNGSPKAVLTPL
jgi:hypothetical protein